MFRVQCTALTGVEVRMYNTGFSVQGLQYRV